MLDLVFQGGTVVDGTGQPGRRADLGVADGRIAAIGDLSAADARERVDVSGRVVSPGFIDIHTHSDVPLLVNPLAESKIRQGVTTEVIGNCGFSPAPLQGPHAAALQQLSALGAKGGKELDWSWQTFGEYLERLSARRPAVNVVPLVGHVPLRAIAMGFDRRPPTAEEMDRMRGLLREALEAGAFGLSTGLVYPPSAYADTEELVELSRVAAEYQGYYFSHIRGEGHSLLRATAEAIEIGERAGVPVEIAHHKATFRPYYGRIRQAIRMSEEAQVRGQDVTFDVYPYTAGSSSLTQIIPDWAHEGGRARLLERLANPADAARIRADVVAQDREWDKTYVTWVASQKNKELEGLSLAQIAERRGIDPVDALFAVLQEEKAQASMVHFCMSEDDVRFVITHPLSTIGSDGSSLAPYGPLSEGKPHPRNYGTFPRVIQVYVREQKAMPLEEAIRKMTGAPARKLRLGRKGLLREGLDADLVVFDPATIRERGTYSDPHHYPEGIDYVVVNGQVAVRRGEHTGAQAGRVIRRGEG